MLQLLAKQYDKHSHLLLSDNGTTERMKANRVKMLQLRLQMPSNIFVKNLQILKWEQDVLWKEW